MTEPERLGSSVGKKKRYLLGHVTRIRTVHAALYEKGGEQELGAWDGKG